ncbi:putative bifunctional diguanylate cyclase/phosphodiesterase [Methyloterricola oryzae]|uniref:putative bifunctional diguanylate cyclase/phosphodiesterase n=1 Tax=Methyloterricola oryzae TaxID=1495050 RepID=UPI0006994D65|nr:EAL domain-containing protein [Methyloterricola oryzae]
MSRRFSVISNKVARRILVSFILAALIPVAILGMLSFREVGGQLREQTIRDLRNDCKAYAMQLLGRLELAKSALGLEVHHLQRSSRGLSRSPAGRESDPILALIAFTADGRQTPLLGKAGDLPELTEKERLGVEAGRALFRATPGAGGARLWMAVKLEESETGAGLLLAELRQAAVWQAEDSYPHPIWVLDAAGHVLVQSEREVSLPQPMASEATRGASGELAWSEAGTEFLGAYWRIPLSTQHLGPDMVVVMAQPKTVAFLPMEQFRALYPPVIALALLFVAYLSGRLIARYLTPLERLKVATERVAGGDLDVRVEIDSGDEFQALGDSFNDMTHRLRRQFDILAALAEIDRKILSSLDAEEIVETALRRLPKILRCDLLSIAQADPRSGRVSDLRSWRAGVGVQVLERPLTLAEAEIQALLAARDGIVEFRGAGALPSYLQVLDIADGWSFMVVPVVMAEALAAVTLGYRARDRVPAEAETTARSFGDRIAVALSNAAWEEKLYQHAHYDYLTGLPNRLVLNDQLQQHLARARRDATELAVLMIDLDRFKNINDSMGHAAGDKLLVQVGQILRESVRETDLVVRMGGDEFVVLAPDLPTGQSVVARLGFMAETILSSLKRTLMIGGQAIIPTASLGIAIFPRDADNAVDLLKNADAALYHAKDQGRANFQFYAKDLNAEALEDVALEHELRGAIARGELMVFYQPKVSLDGRVVGAEALVRWNHGQRGMISPARFIPLAEQTGLIVDLGNWVLEETCRNVVACGRDGLNPVRISVNLSSIEFRRPGLVAGVGDILRRTQVDPHFIELELTESVAIVDPKTCVGRMNDLKHMGLTLAMDDFGTGFSSLSYLKDLPLDVLKIDQSFVRHMESSMSSQAITSAILSLAHGLGLEVVAEGVENQVQLEFLKQHGCGIFQGFYFSRPVPAADFFQLLDGQPFRV